MVKIKQVAWMTFEDNPNDRGGFGDCSIEDNITRVRAGINKQNLRGFKEFLGTKKCFLRSAFLDRIVPYIFLRSFLYYFLP